MSNKQTLCSYVSNTVLCVFTGASPKPFITVTKVEDGMMLLRCEVNGANPIPEVIWRDGAGRNVSSKEPQVSNSPDKKGSYDIVLLTTVTKTDDYACVSTEPEIHHQVLTVTHVTVGKLFLLIVCFCETK